jgi:hypothetical protein
MLFFSEEPRCKKENPFQKTHGTIRSNTCGTTNVGGCEDTHALRTPERRALSHHCSATT